MQLTSRLLLSIFLLTAGAGAGADSINFETDTVGTTPDGWIFDGDSSTVRIVTTTTSGDYQGGLAIRTDDGGSSIAGFSLPPIPIPITSIQADFRWDYASTPTLFVYAWDDENGDGFQSSERTIGFGLDNDGQFELSSEQGEISGATNFAADTWYRLTMTWSAADGLGNRMVTLSAFDLTNRNDLGVVNSTTMAVGAFGVAPSEWDGIAFRMTRGTIDNIQTTTESGTSYSYLDATPANTTLNADPVGFPGGVPLEIDGNYVNDGSSGSGTDDQWTYRTDSNFATFEDGTAFESDPGSSAGDREATDDLITTINLPTPGTYEIVAVFSRSSGRDIAAKIGTSPQAGDVFNLANSLNANQAASSPEIDFNDSFTNSRGGNSGVAYLGTVTTTIANENVRVFVNGLASTPADDEERTQYEGVGYRAVIVTPPSEPKHRDVFLLAGQSNCDGRGLVAQLTGGLASYTGQQPDVIIHYSNPAYGNSDQSLYQKWVTLRPGFSRPPGYSGALPSTTFGMEIGAGKVLSQFYDNPAFIKVSQGGTALGVPGTQWYPAPLDSPDVGPLYEELIETTLSALAELEAAGDTYTVHGMFWHQGESDSGRVASYNGLLTTLIEGVRRDLGMPNLRFVVGELASTKSQTFRDVQWQAARTLPNANFISSAALIASDNTHFDAPSMITFGERVGYAFRPDRTVLDFEAPVNAPGTLNRQDEWSAQPQVLVGNTNSEGEYLGGLAVGPSLSSGEYRFNRRNILPLAGARSMQADFNAGDSDASILVAGWGADAGNDGQFSVGETAIGLGLDSTGVFRVQIGSQSYPSTGFSYQADRWYRLTLTWSELDGNGDRLIRLFARDLTIGVDLNGGDSVLSLTISSVEFAGNPVAWSGIGGSANQGLIDNIQVSPSGFTAWSSLFYPALVGEALDDDDQDGIVNAIEFAFGLDPLSFNSISDLPQPVFGLEATTVSFAPQATQPGTLYQIEWSKDLITWNLVSGTRSGALLNFTVPNMEGSVFIRHRVSLSE